VSDEGQIFAREACDGDAAAYALGALEPAEADAFERHLAECERCAEDLGRFAHVVDALAMSAPQYPVPSGLRRRVMRSVRGARVTPVSRIWSGRTAFATALAVGLAAAILAIGTLVPGGSSKVRVLDARVLDSTGSAQIRLADGRAELLVRHFPAPAAGQIYEVWLKRAGRAPEPTRALFGVSAQGAGNIDVPAALHGVQELLVTQEPAGGSLIPTHPAVIVGRLT
jgi:anti-sigma factor RsiW